jgi:hypothetical protein
MLIFWVVRGTCSFHHRNVLPSLSRDTFSAHVLCRQVQSRTTLKDKAARRDVIQRNICFVSHQLSITLRVTKLPRPAHSVLVDVLRPGSFCQHSIHRESSDSILKQTIAGQFTSSDLWGSRTRTQSSSCTSILTHIVLLRPTAHDRDASARDHRLPSLRFILSHIDHST